MRTFRLALAGVRARRDRPLLAAFGVVAASLMLGVALTVTVGLSTGFERAARRADLPTVTARFSGRARVDVDARVRALPGLQARAYREEFTDIPLSSPGHPVLRRGVVEVVDAGARRGYAIVAGHDVGPHDVVIERGLADAWDLHPGQFIHIGQVGQVRIAGIALAPDNVAYPLSPTARFYLSAAFVARRFGPDPNVNVALLWASPGASQPVLLAQARVAAFGLRNLSFVTQEGVRVIIGQAAGIITALIVAFALVAAALSGVLLAAGAQSDVLRRMPAIGVQRAVGMRVGAVVRLHAAEAVIVAAPAALAGLVLGTVLARGPTGRLLGLLNELAPGPGAQAGLVLGAAVVVTGLVALGAAIPSWLAARRPPAEILRGGRELGRRPRRGAASRRGGLTALGGQLVVARRTRFALVVAALGAATGVILLMIGLAGLLQRLRDDPATLGKRYQLSVSAPAGAAAQIGEIDGVTAAATRFKVDGANSFDLGSPVRLIAYTGDHTRFEAPPLASGRHARGPREAEVGAGLADAQGLSPGSTLAVQLPAGHEVRFRVTGVVRALENEGRIAYVQAGPVLRAQPNLTGPIVVRLASDADRARVSAAVSAIAGRQARTVGGATDGSSGALISVLAAVLRLLAVTVGLVCLYALIQALALTSRERRRAIATLRAGGAGAGALRRLLLGAAVTVCVPALALGWALQAAVLSPGVARLTAGYADLSPVPTVPEVGLVVVGLTVLAAVAAGWTARGLLREPIVAGLREESG